MIAFDVTKASAAGHRSGLLRTSGRLLAELRTLAPGAVGEVVWSARDRAWRRWADGRAGALWTPSAEDRLFTPELFGEEERPGIAAWLASRPVPAAAVYYDAIPLKHPAISWPQSVRRHPSFLKLLACFDRVFAISATSGDELLGWWRWAGMETRAVVETLALGADATGEPRATAPHPPSARPTVLCVGILEPRKRQTLLAEACTALWREGVDFELHFVGRVNPHFGRPIERALRAAARREARLRWHGALDDRALAALWSRAELVAVPSLAEGNGLPAIEALWRGVPVVCSDAPALREHAEGGGCMVVSGDDAAAWRAALRPLLRDPAQRAALAAAAVARELPTWRGAAQVVLRGLAALA